VSFHPKLQKAGGVGDGRSWDQHSPDSVSSWVWYFIREGLYKELGSKQVRSWGKTYQREIVISVIPNAFAASYICPSTSLNTALVHSANLYQQPFTKKQNNTKKKQHTIQNHKLGPMSENPSKPHTLLLTTTQHIPPLLLHLPPPPCTQVGI